ncbi:Ig-like domain-containing protein [Luteolibacter yonseiensis]|uniref:Ig-like domain-containing protein n=1 Tax=Luteolibacter yonseiensis TaxID=1144680 RepID=A0A934R1T2_9BACT|nr:Ig-like domain-containing protein [Luteolibacter yonseiensis]MBK1815202.1 Ig-like domain-containing protein [Luteolibacter yonseiensis]
MLRSNLSMGHSLLCLLASFICGGVAAAQAPPEWWTTGSSPVIEEGAPADNRAMANVGQAKWMTSKALKALGSAATDLAIQVRADLEGTPPDHLDRIINLAVPDPKPADWSEKQRAPLLLGQLKAIARPFYNRLNAAAPSWVLDQIQQNHDGNAILGTHYWQVSGNADYTQNGYFPWNPATPVDANNAPVTIGQLKAVFSLRFQSFPAGPDADGDGLPDARETELGTDPDDPDTDADGMPDGWEILHGFNPLNAADATLDWDSDGNSNSQEYQQDTDPKDYGSRMLPQIKIYGGDGQISPPSSRLPIPLVVRITDAGGEALSNVRVTFQVVSGGGLLTIPPGGSVSTVQSFTDSNGECGVLYGQPGGFNVTSSISATVTSGPNGGSVVFSAQTVSSSLSNDNFANARTITGNEGGLSSKNSGATLEANEPTFLTMDFTAVSSQGGYLCNQTGATVWYSWQAPESRKYRFQTGSLVKLEDDNPVTYLGDGTDFDTVLAVFKGSSLQTLTLEAGNDDGSTVESAVEFEAVSGQTYHIAVDGAEGQTGKFFLNWMPVAPPAPGGTPPANDDFPDAEEISGFYGEVTGSTLDATEESGEPEHQHHEGRHSVWYRWQAPATGTVTFDTAGSRINTILGAYQGSSVGALAEIAWQDDNDTLRAKLVFSVTAGQTYRIMVDSFGNEAGLFKLSYELTGSNDDFADAQLISGDSGTTGGSIRQSTAETGEPAHAGSAPGHSIWYRWTAPQTDTYTFRTSGSAFDTVLGIYTGTSVDDLETIGSNDDGDGRASVVIFEAVQGVTYSVAIDIYGGNFDGSKVGRTVLSWEQGVPGFLASRLQVQGEPPAEEPVRDSDLVGRSVIGMMAESEGQPNLGDAFVSDEDKTIVLLAPKEGELSVACPIPFIVDHSIVTTDTPRERDLKGKLTLTAQSGDPSIVSMGDYTLGTPVDITEPGHEGEGVHDWHRGSERFTVTALKKGSLTLKAEVDPDEETPEGDGGPRTTATINIRIFDVDEVIIYQPETSTDAQWQSAAMAQRWGNIIDKGQPLKVKLVLSGQIPANEEVELCGLKFALFKFNEDPDFITWIDAVNPTYKISPSRTEIWVTVEPSVVEAGLDRFNSSENEFASVEDPGSSSFGDSEIFDARAGLLPDSMRLVPSRENGNENDTAKTVAAGEIPPFCAKAIGDYPRLGGAVYLQVQMINTRSKRRLYRNQADILYLSSHGMSVDGSIASVLPGTVDWKDDLEVVIFAGCSVLDINDYNGNYDNTGDGVTEPGPTANVFSGEQWAASGPKRLLGYNYKAPLDTQGTPAIISSWFANRTASGDIGAWKIANENSSGRNACAIDADGGMYYYFHRTKGLIRNSYKWTSVPRASW